MLAIVECSPPAIGAMSHLRATAPKWSTAPIGSFAPAQRNTPRIGGCQQR
jgi:hypothetical protein